MSKGSTGKTRKMNPESTQDGPYELPEGWVRMSLGDVCAINPRHERGALTDDTPVSFVPMAAVDHRSGTISESDARPYGQVRKGFTHFGEGDVLFARITPCMENGKIAVARGLVNGLGCGTTEFHVLRPLGGILPEYIHRYLRQESFRRAAAANMSGTAGQLRVPTDYIKSVELPLAPLAEQRRIVAKVEALFEQSRTARQALDRIPPLLKKFRQSVLAAAFRGDLTRDWREQHPEVEPASALLERIRAERRQKWEENLRAKDKDPRKVKFEEPERVNASDLPELPEGWVWCRVEKFAEVKGGIQKTPARRPVKNAFPYLRVANVLRGKLDLSKIHYFELLEGELEKWCLLPGDVLVVEGNGSLSEIGRCALWRGEVAECVHQNHIIRVRCYSGINPPYFHWFLNSTQGCDIVTRVASSTSGLYTLSVSKVQRIVVPMAPALEQQQVISRIEALFDVADAIESSVEAARRRADKLEQSILARAFRGELVPQDPNDEPALILLERLRAEHAESNGKNKPKIRARKEECR